MTQPLAAKHLCPVGNWFLLLLGALAVFEIDTHTMEKLLSTGEKENLEVSTAVYSKLFKAGPKYSRSPYSAKAKVKTHE